MKVPPSHPVRDILERHIIPYTVSALRLRRQPFYIIYNIHVYSRDILAGLIGVGISSPVMILYAKATGGEVGKEVNAQSLLNQVSPRWWLVVVAAAAALVALRVWVNNSKADEKAVLLKSCANDMRAASLNLNTILDKPDPTNDLQKMKEKMVSIAVAHVGTWPWDYEPAPGIENEVRARVERLCERFGDKWAETIDIQQVQTAGAPPAVITA